MKYSMSHIPSDIPFWISEKKQVSECKDIKSKIKILFITSFTSLEVNDWKSIQKMLLFAINATSIVSMIFFSF